MRNCFIDCGFCINDKGSDFSPSLPPSPSLRVNPKGSRDDMGKTQKKSSILVEYDPESIGAAKSQNDWLFLLKVFFGLDFLFNRSCTVVHVLQVCLIFSIRTT